MREGADISLAITTIVLGWILSGACLIGAFLEALAVSRHGKGRKALRTSFHRLEAPRRKLHDFSRLAAPRGAASTRSPPQHKKREKDTKGTMEAASAPAELREKLVALEEGRLQVPKASRSGSEVSTKGSASGSDAGEYGTVNTLQWGAPNANPAAVPGEVPNALSGEEVLASPMHEGPMMVCPPEYVAQDMPVLDAERVAAARPGRVPVDRASGYVPDGQAGRGVRSPTRFVQDHYTRPVTPPTRRASHQRSLSQANEAAAALRLSRTESTHTRSKSWDYI